MIRLPLHIPVLTLLAPLLALSPPATGAEPLPADQAFRISGRLAEDGQAVVRLRAAPGYYLYRDKLRFSADPAAVGLGPPRLPPGQELQDEFFGRVRVYRGEVEVRVPVRLPTDSTRFTLVVRSQGCADAGVCYTPQEKRLVLARGQPETSPAGAAPDSLLDRLREGAPAGR